MSDDSVFISIDDLRLNEVEPAVSETEDSEIINIVLATDAIYFYPMLCVIKSACANKLPDTRYQFVLLVDDAFTDQRRTKVNSLLRKYGLPPAVIFNRTDEYLDIEYKADHLTRASCYRLQIPSLLKKQKKCMYLDCDTLVRHDLSKLYSMLEDDELMVGVLAAAYQQYEANAKARAELLGLPDIDTYTNSGVMVMNIDLMRKMEIEDVFDRLLMKGFPDIDQDVLNTACYGYIRLASPKYNAMTKYSFDEDSYESDPAISKCWTFDEWEEARTDPTIVHFADTDKPWTDYALPFAKEWWGYIDEMGMTEEVFRFFYDLHASRQKSVYEMRTKVNAARGELRWVEDRFKREKSDLEAKLTESQERIENLQTRVASKNERIAKQKGRINALKARLAEQRKKTISAQKSLKASRNRLKALKASKSYKLGRALTKPYRAMKGK